MALGFVSGQGSAGRRRNFLILEAATATNSPPSGSSAGADLSDIDNDNLGAKYEAASASVVVYSSAGSATMSCTLRLWGYDSQSAKWYPLGYLNSGNSIAELSADSIRWAEKVDDLFDWDRLYVEVTAIGGTDTAINVALRLPVLVLN